MGLFGIKRDRDASAITWPKGAILDALSSRYKITKIESYDVPSAEHDPRATYFLADAGAVKFLVILIAPALSLYPKPQVEEVGFVLRISVSTASAYDFGEINRQMKISRAWVIDSQTVEVSARLGFKKKYSSKALETILNAWDADWHYAVKAFQPKKRFPFAVTQAIQQLAPNFTNELDAIEGQDTATVDMHKLRMPLDEVIVWWTG